MLVDELLKGMQSGKQTDLILLDFSKAFDKVAHEKLLFKLHHYGIGVCVCVGGGGGGGGTLRWIKSFLDDRSQNVLLNGVKSDNIPVSSGVPQGSVLGPILFLAYINDLPEQVKSNVRLFADDTALYLTFSKSLTPSILQQDLQHLESWEKAWDMEFNPSKCQVIHITRSHRPAQNKYYLHGVLLEAVPAAKYFRKSLLEYTHFKNLQKS